MKKYILIYFTVLASLNLYSQNIIVGNDTLTVSSLRLPLWLSSGEIIKPHTGVGFISVLEFSKDTHGNLVLENPIIVRSQQTVPQNKFWKIESIGVLNGFGETGNNNSGSEGSNSSGNSSNSKSSIYDFTMISQESSTTYSYGNAAIYCDTLTEGGYSDWILPSEIELQYLTAGGAVNSFVRSGTWLHLRSVHFNYSYGYRRIAGNTYSDTYSEGTNTWQGTAKNVRCVR